jgi:GDSL-like Lipase/Acylhydrolase
MKQAPRVYHFVLLWVCSLPITAAATVPDGDVNTDGEVDIVDVLWGMQTVLGSRTLDPTQLAHGDVAPMIAGVSAPNGVFDTGDVLLILRAAMGFLNFSFPVNQFNIGDSIGEGEAANGTIYQPHHETVWSTGYNGSDIVSSFNERFEAIEPGGYYENNASRDPLFNQALSGAEMADFAGQAQAVITAASMTPSGEAGQVTVFLGNNDVCAPSLAEMTDPAVFEAQYRAGLDVLAASDATRMARIHVTGIPAIYWLWNAKRDISWCRLTWLFVPCQNLLAKPADDCASSASRTDPDNDYSGDGPNCLRRKTFHRTIRDTYNPILKTVLEEYRAAGQLPNANFTDIYDVRFESTHVNGGDCFHPSTAGHALIAEKEWCRTQWGIGDPLCTN